MVHAGDNSGWKSISGRNIGRGLAADWPAVKLHGTGRGTDPRGQSVCDNHVRTSVISGVLPAYMPKYSRWWAHLAHPLPARPATISPGHLFRTGPALRSLRLINTAGRRVCVDGVVSAYCTWHYGVHHPLFSPLFALRFVILSVSRLNRFTRPRARLRPPCRAAAAARSHIYTYFLPRY